jgi:hypothetical protein
MTSLLHLCPVELCLHSPVVFRVWCLLQKHLTFTCASIDIYIYIYNSKHRGIFLSLNPLKPVIQVIFTTSVHSSYLKRKSYFITKTARFLLFNEIIPIHGGRHMKTDTYSVGKLSSDNGILIHLLTFLTFSIAPLFYLKQRSEDWTLPTS